MQSINLLTHQWAEKKVFSRFYPEVTSTNDVAKNEFPTLGLGEAIYLADHQSQGKGRGTHSWHNMSGGDILLSTWCFHMRHTVQHVLTPLLGLSVYTALKKMKPSLPIRLKAPNDIYLNDGKLCGLLVEAITQGSDTFLFIGLGLNVFAAPNIDILTSHLSQEVEINMNNWFEFCDQLLRSFKNAAEQSQKDHLSEKNCDLLLEALNQRLPKEEQYIKVHPNCDLETSSQRISWLNL